MLQIGNRRFGRSWRSSRATGEMSDEVRWLLYDRLRPQVSERRQAGGLTAVWCGVSVAGILMLTVGCHSARRSDDLSGSPLSRDQVPITSLGPNHLAAEGLATIAAGCQTQSFEAARDNLIVSRTGLHEDVFALRSRTSSASFAFSLDDALKLEDVLRKQLQQNQMPGNEQDCVQKFEGYLETLTDPVLEQDKSAKELDASAFKDSTNEAQEELKREQQKETQAVPERH
jgi:hypothetical protein